MSARDDGGAAFPVMRQESPNGDAYTYAESGMTLRDYFAAHALVLIATMTAARQHDINRLGETAEACIASDAYDIADAMLKERAK